MLTLGALAIGRREDGFKDTLSHLGNSFLAIQNRAGIEVDVAFHPAVERCVRGHLNAGSRLAAVHTAATRGEHSHVAAAGHQSRHAYRVVAGRIHEAQARPGDCLSILQHRHERGLAAFGHGAEALFEDGGQAALFVAGRGVVTHRGSVFPGVVFPPANSFEQRIGHLAAHRATGEQVFGPINLGSLGQDRCAAVADNLVGSPSQGRVGGDTAVAIGATAVQRHDESTQGLCGSLLGIDRRQ